MSYGPVNWSEGLTDLVTFLLLIAYGLCWAGAIYAALHFIVKYW